MGITRTPTSRTRNNAIWMTAFDNTLTGPGNATLQTCRIIVPFKHKLLRAKFSSELITKAGTLNVSLRRLADAVAIAGVSIGSALADAVMLASAVKVTKEFTLADADKTDRDDAQAYGLSITGTNASDITTFPMLAILVQPIPRIAL